MPESAYDGYKRLRFDRPHPRVLRVTLDNPGKKNSIDEIMHPEMVRVWHDISRDDSVAAVILTGAGDAFCAGGNFEMVDEMVSDHEVRMKNLREARDVVYNMINCTKPIISRRARPRRGRRTGVRDPVGHLRGQQDRQADRRPHAPGPRRGRPRRHHLAAAVRHGTCQVPPAPVHDTVRPGSRATSGSCRWRWTTAWSQEKALEIATQLAEGPPTAIRLTKYTMNHWLRMAGPIFDASLAFEFHAFTGPELAEGLASIREKRKPNFPTHSAF